MTDYSNDNPSTAAGGGLGPENAASGSPEDGGEAGPGAKSWGPPRPENSGERAEASWDRRDPEKPSEPGTGGQMVTLPRDEQDLQAYENIYKALGRPDHPDDYGLADLAAQEGTADPDFIGHMSSSMHQLGLNGRQAQGLMKAYQEAAAKYQAEARHRQSAELRELRAQLGAGFEAQVDCARRAAHRFGLDKEALNTLENAIGSAALIRHLARIGQSLGEEVRVDGQADSPFSLSPAGARKKADDLLNDRDFRERYLAGDKGALDKIARLLEAGAV